MENIYIERHTDTPQSLAVADRLSLQRVFTTINSKQETFKHNLFKIVESIFKSYKRNSFENNKQLNLTSTYFLLQNLSKEDGRCVQILKDRRESLITQIGDVLTEFIDNLGDDIKSFKVETKKIYNDIYDIFSKVIYDYVKETTKSTDSVSTETTNHANIDYDAVNQKLQKINNIRIVSSGIFNHTLNIIKQFRNKGTLNINYFTEKTPKTLSYSQSNITSPKFIILAVNRHLFKRMQNIKTVGGGLLNNILKTAAKMKFKMWATNIKLFANIGKTITRILRSISVGKLLRGFGIGMFKIGVGIIKGGLSVLNFILIKAPLAIVSTVWNLGKFLVNGVKTTVTTVYKNLVRPLFPMILGFFMTTPGAFLLGMISGTLYKKITSFDWKTTVNDIYLKIKDTIGKFSDVLTGPMKDLSDYLDVKCNHADREKFLRVINQATTIDFMSKLQKILEFLQPESLAWSAAGAMGGELAGKIALPVVKALMTSLAPIAGPVAVGALLAGGLTWMVWNWYKYDKKKKKEEHDKKVGGQYRNSLDLYKRIKREKMTSRKFAFNNAEVFKRQSKTITMKGDELEYSDNKANHVINGIIENVNATAKAINDKNQIYDFCKQEAAQLKKEQELIVKLKRDENPQYEEFTKLPFDITYKINGNEVTTNLLPSYMDLDSCIGLRIKNMLYRSKLLMMLKNGELASIDGKSPIETYKEKVKNLFSINNKGVTSFLKDKELDLYTMNLQTTQHNIGFDFKDWQVSKLNNIDLSKLSADDAERVLNATLAVQTAKDNGYKLHLNEETNMIEEDIEVISEATDTTITVRHKNELREILVDICCGLPTKIPQSSYVELRTELEICKVFMSSELVSRKIKEIFQQHRDKFQKVFDVDSFKEKDTKLVNFIYTILQTSGTQYMTAFMDCINRTLRTIFNTNNVYRFISFSDKPTSKDNFVVFNDTQNAIDLYRYNTLAVEQLPTLTFEHIINNFLDSNFKYKKVSGNMWCQIANVTDFCSDKEYERNKDSVQKQTSNAAKTNASKIRISYNVCMLDREFQTNVSNNLAHDFITVMWDLIMFYMQNHKDMSEQNVVEDYNKFAASHSDNNEFVSSLRKAFDAFDTLKAHAGSIVDSMSKMISGDTKQDVDYKKTTENIDKVIEQGKAIEDDTEKKKKELNRLLAEKNNKNNAEQNQQTEAMKSQEDTKLQNSIDRSIRSSRIDQQ